MHQNNYAEIYAEYSVVEQAFNIYMFHIEGNKRYLVTNVKADEIKQEAGAHSPSLQLQKEAAQRLFDDLWKAGLRPQKLDETPAKDEHIKDLRAITFHVLGIAQ